MRNTKYSPKIKIVMRNRKTGELHISMAVENIARAILGDLVVNEVMSKGKVTFLNPGATSG